MYLYIVVTIEDYLHTFTESVSQRDLGKFTSRAEISSSMSTNLKAKERNLLGPVLTGATCYFANPNHKKRQLFTHKIFVYPRHHIFESFFKNRHKTNFVIRVET